jgi:ribonuclease P protein component
VAPRTVGRIQTRAVFSRLQRSRARASCGPVRASFVPVDPAVEGIYPQVGYAIGKHCGNAVVRNSLRRRMRESARGVAESLPRGAYLLRVDPTAVRCDPKEFSAHVGRALQRAAQPKAGGPS